MRGRPGSGTLPGARSLTHSPRARRSPPRSRTARRPPPCHPSNRPLRGQAGRRGSARQPAGAGRLPLRPSAQCPGVRLSAGGTSVSSPGSGRQPRSRRACGGLAGAPERPVPSRLGAAGKVRPGAPRGHVWVGAAWQQQRAEAEPPGSGMGQGPGAPAPLPRLSPGGQAGSQWGAVPPRRGAAARCITRERHERTRGNPQAGTREGSREGPGEGFAARCGELVAEAGQPAAGAGPQPAGPTGGSTRRPRPARLGSSGSAAGGVESGRRRRRDAGLGGGGASLRPLLRPGAGLRGHRRGLRRLRQVRRGDQLLPDRGGRRRLSPQPAGAGGGRLAALAPCSLAGCKGLSWESGCAAGLKPFCPGRCLS